jgi:hypothetical protein
VTRASAAAVLALLLATTNAHAQDDVPPLEEPVPPRDSLCLRVGVLNSGLFDSGQGRPFIYLDFGARYKADGFYVDIKLPAIVAGLDFGSHSIQRLIGIEKPFNLFEALNDPIHYAAYLEPGHARLGQTFDTTIGSPPLQLSAGIFSLFDFAFFDLTRQKDEETSRSFDDIDDTDAIDPFIVAVGGFVAVGGQLPYTAWDLALGAGWDVYQNPVYAPASGAVIYLDLDIQVDPLKSVGGYFRWRLSTYTHMSPIPWTMALGYGAALKLL